MRRCRASSPRWRGSWNVGVLALWYPILPGDPQREMVAALAAAFPEALVSEVRLCAVEAGQGPHRLGALRGEPALGAGRGSAPDRGAGGGAVTPEGAAEGAYSGASGKRRLGRRRADTAPAPPAPRRRPAAPRQAAGERLLVSLRIQELAGAQPFAGRVSTPQASAYGPSRCRDGAASPRPFSRRRRGGTAATISAVRRTPAGQAPESRQQGRNAAHGPDSH